MKGKGRKTIMRQTKLTRRSGGASATLVAMALASLGSLAHAGTEAFDKQMSPILVVYLEIPRALAADQTKGVVAAAKKIKQLAPKLEPGSVSGRHAAHYKAIPAKLRAAADKLVKAKDIDAMREVLKELSKPMALWATLSKPAGISVMYCSMAPGSWLQRGTKVANPYYGAKMLRCGEIVSGVGAKQHRRRNHGGAGQDMHPSHHESHAH
jgi:hypothetical protein